MPTTKIIDSYSNALKLDTCVLPIGKTWYSPKMKKHEKRKIVCELMIWFRKTQTKTAEETMRAMECFNEAMSNAINCNAAIAKYGLEMINYFYGVIFLKDIVMKYRISAEKGNKGGQRGFDTFEGDTSNITEDDIKPNMDYVDSVIKIIDEFSINSIGTITICFCKELNQFCCSDGGHRVLAGIILGYPCFPAQFRVCDTEEEMNEIFKLQDENNSPVTKMEKLSAGINSITSRKDKIITAACEENGVTICLRAPEGKKDKIEYVRGISDFKTHMKDNGESCINTALKLFTDAFPGYKGEIQASWFTGACAVNQYSGFPCVYEHVLKKLKVFSSYDAFKKYMEEVRNKIRNGEIHANIEKELTQEAASKCRIGVAHQNFFNDAIDEAKAKFNIK